MRFGFEIEKMPRSFQRLYRFFITAIMVLAALLTIVYVLISSASVAIRVVLALIALIVSGQIIASVNKIKNASYGLYLLGGKNGIGFVDSLSKRNPRFWNAMSDWGLVLGFGLLSIIIFRKRISWKIYLFGIISIVLIYLFVYPYLQVISNFILNIPLVTVGVPASGTPTVADTVILYLSYIALPLTILGGFGLLLISSLLVKAGLVIYSIVQFFQCLQIGGTMAKCVEAKLKPQSSGVIPLIPGITIPLSAGVIALFIILVVHEFSHGALARISKIKIKSIGIAIFGIIPIGAFVEPDEKKVAKLKVKEQDRISIAGISANLIASLLFFIPTYVMLSYIIPNINTMGVIVTALVPNSPAYNVIPQNSVITAWNGNAIKNQYDLSNVEASYVLGSFVNVTTSTGTYRLMPTPEGTLGIYVGPAVATIPYQITNFLYAVVALTFSLNFFVALVNLLPLPGLDGWRIYSNKIRSKRLLKAIAILIIVAVIFNIVPLIWNL